MEDTQKYITLKTKIFIEETCLGRLKKTEEQGNRGWFYRAAKDHEWHILNCKRAMDKTWSMKGNNVEHGGRPKHQRKDQFKAFQELHGLTETCVFLSRVLVL